MEKWFPEMYDRPENGPVAASAIYWGICYFLIPFVTIFLSWAFSSDLTAVIGVDIATYILNFVCMLSLFRSYLSDSLMEVQLDLPRFLKTVLISTILMLVVELGLIFWGFRWDIPGTLWSYPLSETSVVASTCFIVIGSPLVGTLCMTLLTPVTVSCMFYATVFAPLATKNPKLAYIVTPILLLFPRLLSSWWLHTGFYDLSIYLFQLPVHLIACWAYQKSNSVWAPIVTISITNLLVSLFFLFLSMIGFIVNG